MSEAAAQQQQQTTENTQQQQQQTQQTSQRETIDNRSFWETMDKDLQQDKNLNARYKNSKTASELIRALNKDAQAARGELTKHQQNKNVINIPEGKITPEIFYSTMEKFGYSKEFNAEAYAFDPVEGASSFWGPESGFSKMMQQVFHRAGVHPQQAKAAFKAMGEFNAHIAKQSQERQTLAVKRAGDSLRKHWGDAFDGKIEAVNTFARANGIMDIINTPRVMSNVKVMAALAEAGERLADDRLPGGRAALQSGPTQQQLKDKADAIFREMHSNPDLNHNQRQQMRKQAHALLSRVRS